MTLTDKQHKISELLNNLDPKIADTYKGGIFVLTQTYSEKIPQSASSIRETIYMLTRLDEIKKLGRIKTPHKKSKRKDDLIDSFDPVKTIPNEAYVLYDKLANDMLGWFGGIAHHGKIVTEKQYRNKLNEFEDLIETISEPHFNVITKIDELNNQPATKKNYEKIKLLISRNSSSYNYFLQNGSHKWIKFLIRENYFKKPPQLIREGETIRFSPSFMPYYIQKISDKQPKEISQFISNYTVSKNPEEHNPWVLENFVKAVTKMPIKYGKPIIRKIFEEKWLKMPYYNVLIHNAISELMMKFADAGLKTESLILAKALLDVDLSVPYATGGILEKYQLRRNVIPITDSYFYEKLLDDEILLLFNKFPIETLTLLIEVLRKTIFLENSGIGHPKMKNEDASYLWRPSIDDHPQNSDRDFRSHLLGVVGNMITDVKLSFSEIKKISKILSDESYPVFRRLELHLYTKYPDYFKNKINESVLKCFDQHDLHHEYFHLLKTSFPKLSEKTKKSFFNLIEKGPSKKLLELWNEKSKYQQSGYVELRLQNWKIGKLEPVIEFLNEQEKNKFNILNHASSPHPDFISYRDGPKISEPITELTDNLSKTKVFEFIKSYKPKKSDFGYYDGTFEKFQEYVQKNPLEYSQCTEKLKGLPLIFTHKFFDGIKNSIDSKPNISWKNIISLANFIIESTQQTNYKASFEFNVLQSLTSLIEKGIETDSIDFSLKTDVWKILKLLVSIDNTDNNWEENYPTKDWDALGISINTVNGVTFHSILKFSIWCNKHLKKTKKIFVPEVKELLSLYLDKKIINTVSRQAVLGHHLPILYYFDKNWIVKHLDDLFKNQEEKLSRASWDGYLTRSVYSDIFEDLISEYTNHIQKLDVPFLKDGNLTEFDKRVIDHVTIAYLYKYKQSKKIFNYMLDHSHEKVLSHCSWFIGRILKEQKENPSKLFDKNIMYQIWNNSKLTSNEELSFWVENSPFDKNQTLKLLNNSLKKSSSKNIRFLSSLVSELIPFAKSHPSSTIKCLELLIKMRHDNPELHLSLTSLKEIFMILLNKSASKQKTIALIHYLGELDFNEFRELLLEY